MNETTIDVTTSGSVLNATLQAASAVYSSGTATVATKKLLNVNIQESLITLSDSEISYGAHIRAVVGDTSAKTMKSILGADTKDSGDTEVINTYIFVDPVTKDIKELNDHPWLIGAVKSVNMESYPESIQKTMVASLNKVKGIFKDGSQINVTPENADAFLNDSRIKDLKVSLAEAYKTLVDELKREKSKYANVGVDDFINRYAFVKHIMLLGPRGGGKTYNVSKYIADKKLPSEFIAGHAGLEAVDLLGYYVKDQAGSLIWMDGPLTAAFRSAIKGESVFFVDEILRIPTRELNILIGALTPDSSGNFTLRTNRVVGEKDGLGKSETLIVPSNKLWVVATTNIGSDYDTEDMDLALSDRFRMIDMTVTPATVRSIMDARNTEGKFSSGALDRLLKLYSAVDGLVKTQELANTMNVRYLSELIDMCPSEDHLTSYIYDLVPNICSRTTEGLINAVEEKTFKDTVKRTLGA